MQDISERQVIPASMLRRAISSMGFFFAFLGVAMFLPAGDIRWLNGWLFLLTFFVLTVPSIAYLWHVNPEIFIARSRIHTGTKGWDKLLVALLLISLTAEFPIAAVDSGRFHWSNVPPWVIVLGHILLCVGYLLSDWTYAVNKFAEPSVRIQRERGHKVIDSGPYAAVRHPLYVGAIFIFVSVPLALGSLWALIPAAVAATTLVVRTVLEDKTLQAELGGYKQYAARVRYRLIPGVW